MNERNQTPSNLNKARDFNQGIEPVWSVWYLLYRFLWPFQYFLDVNQGDYRQQQLNYQHNRSMRFCLPGFMFKWSALSILWFAWGFFLDGGLSFTLLVALCFVAGSLALIVVVLLGINWLWLDQFSNRF